MLRRNECHQKKFKHKHENLSHTKLETPREHTFLMTS